MALFGTLPTHVKVLELPGVRVKFWVVPFQDQELSSKTAVTDQLPLLAPVFLKVIFTVKAAP